MIKAVKDGSVTDNILEVQTDCFFKLVQLEQMMDAIKRDFLGVEDKDDDCDKTMERKGILFTVYDNAINIFDRLVVLDSDLRTIKKHVLPLERTKDDCKAEEVRANG